MRIRHPVVVVIGIVRRNNTFLLTKRDEPTSRAHGKWQFPGGGLEYKEKVEDCLVRELKEETGVSVRSYRLLPTLFQSIRSGWHGILPTYVCVIDDDAVITLNHEASEYAWLTLEEIKKRDCLELTLQMAEATKLLDTGH